VALLFGTGVAMSLGHCLGMCGPLVSAFAVAQGEPGAPRLRLAPPLLVYQLGRVTTYAAIGAAVGLVGAAATLKGSPQAVMGGLSLATGALMLVAAASLAGWVPLQSMFEAAPLGRAVSRAIAGMLRARRTPSRFMLGVANGFLPCGPVAAAAIAAASTGSPGKGALAMAAFGAGTVPALVVLGLGTGILDARVRARLYRLGAMLVALVGVQLVLRGLHALAVIGPAKIGPVVLW
jgi:sulfite exporter TauE/SafE